MVFVFFFLASRTDYGICDVDVLKVAVAARTQLPCPPAEDEVVVVFVYHCFWFSFSVFIFGLVVHLGALEWKGLLGNENLRVVNHSVQSVKSVQSVCRSSEMIAGLG